MSAFDKLFPGFEEYRVRREYLWTPFEARAARKRTRKLPATTWHWSADEPALRRRILSLPYLGHDEIDPDKPYLVSEEGGTISIVQDEQQTT